MPLDIERILVTPVLHDTYGRSWNENSAKKVLSPNLIPDRHGIPTNLEAMKEYISKKDEVSELIGIFRDGFSEDDLTLGELWELASTIYRLPLYLSLRARSQASETNLSPALVDASRATAGIVAVTHSMLSEFMPSMRISPPTIYDYASGGNSDQINYFITEDGEDSCPAPKQMVLKMLDALISSPDDHAPELLDIADGLFNEDDIQGARSFALYHQLFVSYVQSLEDSLPTTKEGTDQMNQRIRMLYDELSSSLGYRD